MNRAIIISFIITMVFMVIMQKQNERIKSPATPKGIYSFQTSKNIQEANQIISVIGDKKLKRNTYTDFGFIAAYITLMFLCCKSLIQNYTKRYQRILGYVFLELSLAIGAFDLIENIVMLMTLSGNGSQLSVNITRYACYAKWGAAILVMLYIFASSVLIIICSVRKEIAKQKSL